MNNNEDLAQFIEHGREERNLEYKSSMDWKTDSAQMKVVKAALALTNIRDGGTIVFGMEEKSGGQFEPAGMSQSDFDSFAQDDVQTKVNTFADPYIHLKVEKVTFEKKLFVIIQVQPFDALPVICKKSGKDIFEGQIFTRPFKRHESAVVKSQTEMREILDIATDNGLRQFHQRLARTGLAINETETGNNFDQELEGL